MKWMNWKYLLASGAALVAGIGYAAGRGERMARPPHLDALLGDLSAAADQLEPHSPAREAIEAGDLDSAREMLSFQPYNEGPLPEGFPGFTPVGVIEVKTYPAYRKAVGPAFWPLFGHIQKRGIPTTVPVEMKSTDTAARGDGEMAFLYQSTEVGELGPIDGVEVEDTPKTLVASLGMRGRLSEEAAKDARDRLNAWLTQQDQYAAAETDSFRVFGYSSPMVRDKDKYWEAQLILQRSAGE